MPETSHEDAVRRYLAWIDDPRTAVDEDAVAAAEKAFAGAGDPIAKLHAAAAAERARTGDADALTSRFVAHARAYADAEGIPVGAFRTLGVDDQVLARAGFELPVGRGRGPAAPARRGGAGLSAAPRSPQVGAGRLKEVAGRMAGPFTLSQLAEEAGGGSPATVRKAVEELVAEGRAANLGPDPDHRGPGRVPTRFEVQ